MEEFDQNQYNVDLLFSRCARAKGMVYFDGGDHYLSRVSLWSGTTGVNTYNTRGIEIDHWNFTKEPKNREDAEKQIKEHYDQIGAF